MVVVICGSREWTDAEAIRREILSDEYDLSPESDIIIEGEARGADLLAKAVALELGWTEHHNLFGYPARWDRYGKAAGHFRNVDMQQALVAAKNEGQDVLVLAFTPDIEKSRGTRDMVKLAKEAGIPVEVFNE